MKLTILAILFSVNCFGQAKGAEPTIEFNRPFKDGAKADSMDIKVISMNEFNAYLERINKLAKKNINIENAAIYDLLFKEMQAIYKEADKKRKINK